MWGNNEAHDWHTHPGPSHMMRLIPTCQRQNALARPSVKLVKHVKARILPFSVASIPLRIPSGQEFLFSISGAYLS